MNNKFGLLDSDIEAIIRIMIKHANVEHALIFGSRAKGNYKHGSDVDIALKGSELDFDTLAKISYLLNEESAIPYKFDLLDYHNIKEPALKNHIDRVGIEIYRK